ncbi:unnamed protein product [Taenia asiatica]|uniref:Uncharacterized protein n=1 Tax=Taenia asiatica TaxID=60517 RepID=A0A0R3WF74_TAEAS|nr:unnamed protein product [Taenia asiatica]
MCRYRTILLLDKNLVNRISIHMRNTRVVTTAEEESLRSYAPHTCLQSRLCIGYAVHSIIDTHATHREWKSSLTNMHSSTHVGEWRFLHILTTHSVSTMTFAFLEAAEASVCTEKVVVLCFYHQVLSILHNLSLERSGMRERLRLMSPQVTRGIAIKRGGPGG